MSGDNASFLSGVADTANVIQSFNSDGFQVGTNASTNTSASLHHYFAFKAGANFKVGTYTGNALTQVENLIDDNIRELNKIKYYDSFFYI